MSLHVQPDDLSSAATRALIAMHVDEMHDGCPTESVHALDATELQHPAISFFSAWNNERLAGIGALKQWGESQGEIKSMRVADDFRGTGVGRAILDTLIDVARQRSLTGLWLETGSSAPFAPARHLYARAGFVECDPFADYAPDPLSVFMTLDLDPSRSAVRT
ncbi:GNAT family N-acetyltransferase [Microbacterium sp. C7(2022)]|uniref:GNAT family N-acetyltransferase n=1 Tax=Microbacterium sp. C7(2022) TaxID=2992759 RepID=UPI00237A36C0|nr:GNAT family N-acetyltransferase [Microbacterium sp. C7(2022)]MDE0547130.1 GNAT family N-acetyltransferase [Microbacterium sp. C7(2022)]